MAFTPEQEAALKALLDDSKRIYDLNQASSSDAFQILVDNVNYPEAKYINKDQLFYDGVVENQAAADKNIAVSNYSFANTPATTGRRGTIKTADNTTAAELIDTERALVAANMPSIFNTIFNATNSYTISDLDSSIGCTVDGITIWDESVVGKQVTGEVNITVTIPSVVNNISILMEIPNLPKNTAAAGWGAYPEPTLGDKYFPMGVIVGVSGGKLIVNLTKNANAWNNGTYQLAIGYKYLIA